MNTREKAGSTATEVIADLTKKLNTVNADMEYICEEVRKAKAMFDAIRYAISEDMIEDPGACLDGFYHVLEVLLDNAQDMYGVSDSFVLEVV